jgi:hypothetical protein
VWKEELFSILIAFGVPVKLVRLIEMFLNEVYNKVSVGKYLSDMFPIQTNLTQGDALSPLISNFASVYYYYYLFELQMGFYPVAVVLH